MGCISGAVMGKVNSREPGPATGSSVQFSNSVISNSWRPHGLQHTRLPCPSPTLRAYSNSCPLTVMQSNHLILCCPLLLLPSVFPGIRVFSNESALCISWRKYWSFSFSISPSNEYSRLISLRIDWFEFLAVQGILKSLLQHHSSKASIHQHSAFFMVQLYGPAFFMVQSSIHDYWKNHSFDYTDLSWQSNISAF